MLCPPAAGVVYLPKPSSDNGQTSFNIDPVRKPFKPVRSLSKSKEVFQILRAAILSGGLQPGDSLTEAHLARQMNVSQVPVREALLQLEHLGLVVRVQDKGTTVTKLSRAEMVELLEVRAHLEDSSLSPRGAASYGQRTA